MTKTVHAFTELMECVLAGVPCHFDGDDSEFLQDISDARLSHAAGVDDDLDADEEAL